MEGFDCNMDWADSASCGFDIVDGQFVVVTADDADVQAYGPLCALLKRVRKAFGIEAAFVAHWAGGAPVVHRAQGGLHDGGSQECDGVHAMYGRRLLEEAWHASAGSRAVRFEAVPVISDAGLEYGTLCAYRIAPDDGAPDPSHPRALRSVARLISEWFEEAELTLSGLMPLRGDSVMGSLMMAG